MIYTKRYLLVVLMLVLIGACKKDCTDAFDPNCSNYDVCLTLPSRPADFDMYLEMTTTNKGIYKSFVEEGAALKSPNTLTLEALYPNASSYRWQVGNETVLREGRIINVGFNNPLNAIAFTLYVTFDEDDCFTSFEGADTLTKTVILKTINDIGIYGKYFGEYSYLPGVKDTIEISNLNNLVPATAYLWKFPFDCGFIAPNWGVKATNLSSRDILFHGDPASSSSGIQLCNETLVGRIRFSEDYQEIEIFFESVNGSDKEADDFNFQHSFNGEKI